MVLGFIIAAIYFLRHKKKIEKNVPDEMKVKGGIENGKSKNKEVEGGGSGRDGGGDRGRVKRNWFGRRRKSSDSEQSETISGFEHPVPIQSPIPISDSERQDGTTDKSSKRDWPSFE